MVNRFRDCSERVIGAAIEVHRTLGPGLLESAYQACLAKELELRGMRFEREVALPVHYKGVDVEAGYRLDFVVNESVVVEVKAVERLLGVHEAQLITYLRLANYPIGLLINFNAAMLRYGLRRLCSKPPNSFPPFRLPVKKL